MNLDQIETKCFILALFIRDDGERFLLGSRAYEFVDSQLHFVANSYQNDIVEVQGNDGVMLAGQVRRGTSQPFDGYIGDQTVDRSTIEQYRRDFMKFFRKNHYYKVVYVFPDGSAVQRRNGFIVEAPEVKELYQLFPQYHISMNFEDINYYLYEEDSDGEEIYGESAILKIATSATGGLIWEEGTESEITGEGSQFTLQDTIDGNVLNSVQLKGDTTQQTYSGKNLFSPSVHFTSKDNVDVTNTSSTIDVSGGGYATYTIPTEFSTNDSVTLSGIATPKVQNQYRILYRYSDDGSSWTGYLTLASGSPGVNVSANFSGTVTGHKYYRLLFYAKGYAETGTGEVKYEQIQFEKGTATTFEPYVGGIASPNPDYPQPVQVVTGEQTVTITDGGEDSQEYEVNLGKNLWNPTPYKTGSVIAANGQDYYLSNGVQWEYKSVLPSAEYTFSITGGAQSGNMRIHAFDNNGTWIQQIDVVPIQSGVGVTKTIVTPANIGILRWSFLNDSTSNQLEKGSTATTYAPYISHFGKNIYPNQIYKTGYVIANDGSEAASTGGCISEAFGIESGETYTLSWQTSKADSGLRLAYYASDMTFIRRDSITTTNPLVSTAPNNAVYARLSYYNAEVSWIQLEQGSTATPYQPFIGGQLELCKIGGYQDYIYKSGDDWYLHKETEKIDLYDYNSAYWYVSTSSTGSVVKTTYGSLGITNIVKPSASDVAGIGFCNFFTIAPSSPMYFGNIKVGFAISTDGLYFGNNGWSVNDFKSFISNNTVYMYYALATATDTQITNTALIEQLEALAAATTYNGQTVFAVSSPNQLAILDVIVIARTGGGVVWDNYGAEWEEGTGGGPTMVNIDSIDNVYPVWTLTGPAVNPQISVLTTNTTLSYSGTITASQELKIDMFNKTATLNGASVVGNVSGDWVYLKPGINRITYTTNNADAPDSTIWWQEIVG